MDPKLLLIILLLTSMAMMLAYAFAGEANGKAQTRRLSAITDRFKVDENIQVEARMRRAISARIGNKQQHSSFAALVPNPENLTKRLAMTGKNWTLNQYLMACAGIFLAVVGWGLLRDWSLITSFFFGTAAGLCLPHLYVSRLIGKRVDNFTINFPDALELMVRGLRSGLPVSETLNVVATEVPGSVGAEFKLVTERIKIGKSMDQALIETADRLGTAEIQFFCITLAIQRETGGNLAETLNNLATVLRQRAQMKLKIKAMSSEAKASAYIIGALPFLVFGIVSWMNFHYMEPFYTSDPNGLFGLGLMQLVGIGGMGWMGMGVFIMAQMINFEI